MLHRKHLEKLLTQHVLKVWQALAQANQNGIISTFLKDNLQATPNTEKEF